MTNGDKIRKMDNKNLAKLIESFFRCERCPAVVCCKNNIDLSCFESMLKWLDEGDDETIYHIECKNKDTDEMVLSFDVKEKNCVIKDRVTPGGGSTIIETEGNFNRTLGSKIPHYPFF